LSLSIAAMPPFSWCSAIRGRCAVRASDRAHRLQHDPRRLHLAPARLSPRHRLRIRAPALGLENPHRYRRCATRLQGRVMRDTFFVDDTVTMAMIRKPGSQQACAPRLRLCKRGAGEKGSRSFFGNLLSVPGTRTFAATDGSTAPRLEGDDLSPPPRPPVYVVDPSAGLSDRMPKKTAARRTFLHLRAPTIKRRRPSARSLFCDSRQGRDPQSRAPSWPRSRAQGPPSWSRNQS
jgi:hypothetical protein